MVLAMSVIVLFAVGSDDNLLLVSRFKEQIPGGLVFALTTASMVISDLRILGQVGTTIGLGPLFDTSVAQSFMAPAIAALLGRWFWWPDAAGSGDDRVIAG